MERPPGRIPSIGTQTPPKPRQRYLARWLGRLLRLYAGDDDILRDFTSLVEHARATGLLSRRFEDSLPPEVRTTRGGFVRDEDDHIFYHLESFDDKGLGVLSALFARDGFSVQRACESADTLRDYAGAVRTLALKWHLDRIAGDGRHPLGIYDVIHAWVWLSLNEGTGTLDEACELLYDRIPVSDIWRAEIDDQESDAPPLRSVTLNEMIGPTLTINVTQRWDVSLFRSESYDQAKKGLEQECRRQIKEQMHRAYEQCLQHGFAFVDRSPKRARNLGWLFQRLAYDRECSAIADEHNSKTDITYKRAFRNW